MAAAALSPSPCRHPQISTMSTNSIEVVRGTHQFIVTSYIIQRRIGLEEFIRSGAFEVGGYSWAIRCYHVGETTESEGCISLFLELMSTFTKNITVTYSFKISGPAGRFHQSPLLTTDFTYVNKVWGCSNIPTSWFTVELDYLMDDRITVHCTVEVYKEPKTGATRSHFIDVPPPSICQDLARILENKQGSDVTFQVGSDEYAAHRTVLAMRSPVFAAQFFGPMADDSRIVRIHDMEPAAFEAVLHFIYTDSLPPIEDGVNVEEIAAGSSCHESLPEEKVRDWLAAADRYGLDRMRLLCENVLCESIDVDNVAATLVLADRHHCPQLKSFCLDYIAASPGLLKAVLPTEGYKVLMVNYPSLLAEILEKIASYSC